MLALCLLAGCGSADDTGSPSKAADSNTTVGSQPSTAAPATTPTALDERNPYEVAGINDPQAFELMFTNVQQAIAAGDQTLVASYGNYPIRVNYADGTSEQVADAKQFVARYDKIITPSVVQAMKDQAIDNLFVNWQGVMAGAGQMWFGATDDSPQRYGIIAINP
ncbi:hypothetical protein DFQ01_101275 [Paenibacillus cellulosilyticus]|uniref:Uncharacterized protein n=1 Tax=Paenibacillus cellulosilyticus TaxID=375489 RepID=A0A2V2Z172_9BACL|nr:hypothetical protein [Paenibacillus cellulosilyticus]PWW08552.1 hypothetical protein DFQ01_101275 [Paenibacillus cellulosilyticus]QKS48127.1 hypothetical protein HUB94_27995 [Paenibacillus cellulosilyticus]